MSRGGRGGGFRGGRMRLGGQELPWDYDPELANLESKPDETFPAIELPRPKAPTEEERRIVANYRRFRSRLHDGPLYGVLGDDMKIAKSHMPKGAKFNPFDGMPTYGKKFKKGTRKWATFNTRTYSLEFFPRELWDAIDAKIQPYSRLRMMDTGNMTPEERERAFAQLNEAGGGDGEAEKADEEAKDSDEEDQSANEDDDLSEDDDEMAGDYNAEGYFDTGEGDGDGWNDEGGGEDDGGYD